MCARPLQPSSLYQPIPLALRATAQGSLAQARACAYTRAAGWRQAVSAPRAPLLVRVSHPAPTAPLARYHALLKRPKDFVPMARAWLRSALVGVLVAQSAQVARCQRRAPPSFTNAPPSTHSPTAAASTGGAADARGDAHRARSAAARRADESVKRAGTGGASSGGGVIAILEPAGKVDCEVPCVCVSVFVQSPHSTARVCLCLSVPSSLSRTRLALMCVVSSTFSSP